MSRYKVYPEYKSFNSTWFDSLPSHWQSVSMKWITNLYAGGTPSKDNLYFWENGSIPWLNSGSVNQSLIEKPSAFITRDAFNNSSAKWIPKGSLVMALAGQGKTKGMVAQLAIESTCNQSMAAIVPSQIVSPRFLFWWLTRNYQKIRNMAGGDLRDGLNLDLLGNISCPIFDSKEQQKIAHFLDHETSKIDTLIAKQEKLIELLKEKRQAVISHAVTKGLNPDVKMKDSGVEWLGEVPEHWTIKKVKYCARLLTDKKIIENNFVIALENIEGSTGEYFQTDSKYVGEDVAFKKGDVLFSKLRPYLSKVFLCPCDGIAFGDLLTYRPIMSTHSSFLFYSMISEWFIELVDRSTYGAKMPRASVDFINNMFIALPSFDEQQKIAQFLDHKTAKIDTLIQKANHAIELMKERKTALISAAVTGKIDVRDWQEDNITRL